MDDARLVRRLERVSDLFCDRQRVGQIDGSRRPPPGDQLGKILSLDQLHHEGVALDPVNRGDVRMIERRERFRFALEAHQAIGIASKRLGQDLQRHIPIELRVSSPIDHAAGANLRGDLVLTDAGAGGDGHLSPEYTCRAASIATTAILRTGF